MDMERDSLKAFLTALLSKAEQLRTSITLFDFRPPVSWSDVLGQFAALAVSLANLRAALVPTLRIFVLDPVDLPKDASSVVVPLMLRTKLPPDIEQSDAKNKALPEYVRSTEPAAQLAEVRARIDELNKMCDTTSRAYDRLLEEYGVISSKSGRSTDGRFRGRVASSTAPTGPRSGSRIAFSLSRSGREWLESPKEPVVMAEKEGPEVVVSDAEPVPMPSLSEAVRFGSMFMPAQSEPFRLPHAIEERVRQVVAKQEGKKMADTMTQPMRRDSTSAQQQAAGAYRTLRSGLHQEAPATASAPAATAIPAAAASTTTSVPSAIPARSTVRPQFPRDSLTPPPDMLPALTSQPMMGMNSMGVPLSRPVPIPAMEIPPFIPPGTPPPPHLSPPEQAAWSRKLERYHASKGRESPPSASGLTNVPMVEGMVQVPPQPQAPPRRPPVFYSSGPVPQQMVDANRQRQLLARMQRSTPPPSFHPSQFVPVDIRYGNLPPMRAFRAPDGKLFVQTPNGLAPLESRHG